MSDIPIHVAIPAYNNSAGLQKLLPMVLQQPFSSVTVLDDASTDDTERLLIQYPKVRHIKAERNGGAVAAKNLILRSLPADGFVLFIDSDMEVLTTNIPAQLASFITLHPRLGAGVGKVLHRSGEPMRFNRGYDLNPYREILVGISFMLYQWTKGVPMVGSGTRYLASFVTMDVHDPDTAEQVDWGVEGFFFVRADLFEELGGFDTRFTFLHEGPDLCLRLRTQGHQVWYVPSIVAKHHDQHSGSTHYRAYHALRSLLIYFVTHPSRLLIYKYPRPK